MISCSRTDASCETKTKRGLIGYILRTPKAQITTTVQTHLSSRYNISTLLVRDLKNDRKTRVPCLSLSPSWSLFARGELRFTLRSPVPILLGGCNSTVELVSNDDAFTTRNSSAETKCDKSCRESYRSGNTFPPSLLGNPFSCGGRG
jgi:hypothetical protein